MKVCTAPAMRPTSSLRPTAGIGTETSPAASFCIAAVMADTGPAMPLDRITPRTTARAALIRPPRPRAMIAAWIEAACALVRAVSSACCGSVMLLRISRLRVRRPLVNRLAWA